MRWGFVEHDALFFFWGTWLLPCWHADTVTCWSYWRISWIAGKCDPITDFSCNFCWAGKRHHRCFPSFKMLPAVKASPPWASIPWNTVLGIVVRVNGWKPSKNQPLETTVPRLFPLVDIETFWKDVLPPPAVLVSSTSGFRCELCHQVTKDMKRSHVSRSLSNLYCGLFFKIQRLIRMGTPNCCTCDHPCLRAQTFNI